MQFIRNIPFALRLAGVVVAALVLTGVLYFFGARTPRRLLHSRCLSRTSLWSAPVCNVCSATPPLPWGRWQASRAWRSAWVATK